MSNAQVTPVAMDAQASNSSNVWASAHQRFAAITALLALWAMKGHVRYSYLTPIVATPKPAPKIEVTTSGFVLLPEGEQPFEATGEPAQTRGVSFPASRPTMERIAFLRSLGPVAMIAREDGLVGGKRSYAGFVFETSQGRIAVLEADATKNAAYVFDADDPSWVELAKKTKAEVINSGHVLFMGRVIHDRNGRWQEKLRNTLS